MPDDPRIAPAFAAARDYDAHALVQRTVARRLAGRIAALPLPPEPRLLEIGCGTGFLTTELHARGIGGAWLVTDLAPDMVARCREKLGQRPATTFRALDGEGAERPPEAPFDLICASLAFQWFADPPGAVARLIDWLAPGGQLVFTTLAAGTFAEWGEAHRAEGVAPGTPHLLPPEALARLLPGRQAAPPVIESVSEVHADARAFLRSIRAIGAGTPHKDHRPLSPATLRRVMARFEQAGAVASYAVATCHFRRET